MTSSPRIGEEAWRMVKSAPFSFQRLSLTLAPQCYVRLPVTVNMTKEICRSTDGHR